MDQDLELAVWRILGRDLELKESAAELLQALARSLPAQVLIVRRIDGDHQRIETVAVASLDPDLPPLAARTELPQGRLAGVLAWCSQGAVRAGAPAQDALLALLAPAGLERSMLAAPLAEGNGPHGLLLLAAKDPRPWESEHLDITRRLLGPLAAALSRELQLHELKRLRESLEADKEALLTRLQRDEIVDSVVGADAGLREVMARVEQVAPTDVPVLILGETGAGKEVVARAIHERSARAAGPMVRVNCGAIPSELVDSELFGHERGSFTGAVAARKGWFERADGGTLFLDEFGELSQAAQVRLLRILQDGTLERVGGQRTISVDVRVVAATAGDLLSMVGEGRFREDLWYRISVFPIRLPPLRERPEDIPALAVHFASRVGRRLGGSPLVPGAEDLNLLLGYSWPGNVRELAAVIERAAILGNGKRLEVAAALGVTACSPARPETNGARNAPSAAVEAADFAPLDAAMARHIEKALALTNGRVEGRQGAARLLRINPHTLRARMRKLGVDWSRFRGQAEGKAPPTGAR
ncbi:MAG: sigma 54-interacting transcriptional regulator [Planctomycetes bacterium]|nr:sigma 54-interacting transcriptional regulator [Planctomycetota bacterium]